MALFVANYGFDINKIDFNWFYRNNQEAFYEDDIGITQGNVTYSDYYALHGKDGSKDLGLDLIGDDLTINYNNYELTGGTVKFVGEYIWGADKYNWFLQGFSIAAVDFGDAILTKSNSDDLDLISQALSGDDQIYLSQYKDVMKGYAGNDEMYGYAGADNLKGGGGNDYLAGGAQNDILKGGSGDDELDGGAGADEMTGGDGNDLYYVDNTGDVVIETNESTSTAEIDFVFSALLNYKLGANVEWGGILGSGSANLTGNKLDNALFSGAGDNVLKGGDGTDTVSYEFAEGAIVASLATSNAQATGSSGSDTLISIESLWGSKFDDTLTGNGGKNVLDGWQGSDTLDGAAGNDWLFGGLGNDTLTGGADRDKFVFNTELSATTNVDSIVDFNVLDDLIYLENAIFSQLTATGTLSSSLFYEGAAAADGDDYVIYNSATGALSYDADGNGGGEAIQFAELEAGLALSAADFVVI